jgi:hypothetical protein
MAAHSPPIPKPVRKRKAKNHQVGKETAVRAGATRYTARVITNSFLRPNRSVSRPQNRAPEQAYPSD